MFSRLLTFTLILSSLLFTQTVSTANAQSLINKIVAVVNGEIITLYDLQQRAYPELRKRGLDYKNEGDQTAIREVEKTILDSMVLDKLIIQEAQKINMDATVEEAENEAHRRFRSAGVSPEQAWDELSRQGITKDEYIERIRTDILRQRLLNFMVGRKVVVTNDEIAEYYEANKSDYSTERKVVVQLLVFAADADAQAVAEKVRAGDLSFEEAVSEYSVGPARSKGGTLGQIAWMDLSDEWRNVLENTDIGEVAPSFIDVNGMTGLLKLKEEEAGASLPLEDVREKIEMKLRGPQLEERYDDFAQKLRDKAVIDIRL